MGEGFASGAFVDPAKYELYDCQQLAAERATLAERTTQLQDLMAKARTGVAGSAVAEIAYRNDYISTRAAAKLVNETWESHRCTASPQPAPDAASAPVRGRR